MEWIQVWTMIGAMAGIVGLQSFWIGRSLDEIRLRIDRVDQRIDRVELRLDRIELRLDRIETSVLRDHGERIARLEQRVSE